MMYIMRNNATSSEAAVTCLKLIDETSTNFIVPIKSSDWTHLSYKGLMAPYLLSQSIQLISYIRVEGNMY